MSQRDEIEDESPAATDSAAGAVDLGPIFDAAATVFARRGYELATIEEVADEAGVDAAAIQSRFADLATLLLATLTRRDDSDSDIAGMLDEPGGLQFLEGIRAMQRLSDAKAREIRLHVRISTEAAQVDHPAHRWAVERYRWMRPLFAAAIRRDQQAGRIRADVDAAAIAVRVIAMMDGLQFQWVLEPEAIDISALFDGFIDDLIAQIRVV